MTSRELAPGTAAGQKAMLLLAGAAAGALLYAWAARATAGSRQPRSSSTAAGEKVSGEVTVRADGLTDDILREHFSPQRTVLWRGRPGQGGAGLCCRRGARRARPPRGSGAAWPRPALTSRAGCRAWAAMQPPCCSGRAWASCAWSTLTRCTLVSLPVHRCGLLRSAHAQGVPCTGVPVVAEQACNSHQGGRGAVEGCLPAGELAAPAATRSGPARPLTRRTCGQAHLQRIVPEAEIEAEKAMFGEDTADALLGGSPDFVLDAIDNLNTKVAAACLLVAGLAAGEPCSLSTLGRGRRAGVAHSGVQGARHPGSVLRGGRCAAC